MPHCRPWRSIRPLELSEPTRFAKNPSQAHWARTLTVPLNGDVVESEGRYSISQLAVRMSRDVGGSHDKPKEERQCIGACVKCNLPVQGIASAIAACLAFEFSRDKQKDNASVYTPNVLYALNNPAFKILHRVLELRLSAMLTSNLLPEILYPHPLVSNTPVVVYFNIWGIFRFRAGGVFDIRGRRLGIIRPSAGSCEE